MYIVFQLLLLPFITLKMYFRIVRENHVRVISTPWPWAPPPPTFTRNVFKCAAKFCVTQDYTNSHNTYVLCIYIYIYLYKPQVVVNNTTVPHGASEACYFVAFHSLNTFPGKPWLETELKNSAAAQSLWKNVTFGCYLTTLPFFLPLCVLIGFNLPPLWPQIRRFLSCLPQSRENTSSNNKHLPGLLNTICPTYPYSLSARPLAI